MPHNKRQLFYFLYLKIKCKIYGILLRGKSLQVESEDNILFSYLFMQEQRRSNHLFIKKK